MTVPVIFCDSIEVSANIGPDIKNITDQLLGIVKKSGVHTGTLNATVIGSTGSVTTIEFEPGVVQDLKEAIERLAPQGMTEMVTATSKRLYWDLRSQSRYETENWFSAPGNRWLP